MIRAAPSGYHRHSVLKILSPGVGLALTSSERISPRPTQWRLSNAGEAGLQEGCDGSCKEQPVLASQAGEVDECEMGVARTIQFNPERE